VTTAEPRASIFSSAAPPVQLTGFIGREAELVTLRALLGASRLLTLTGAGGSGKTRLALEAVRRLNETGETDVAWVELASLIDSASLVGHVALSLGVRAEGGGSAEEALIALLRGRALLLVLDNCEHLVDECARLVERLLRACPELRVLATSREALRIDGERSWLVPPLSVPGEDAALAYEDIGAAESVRLFIERARDVQPGFALSATNAAAIARICRRLDGLPLAIELAAARVSVLTPEQIAARLDDRFGLLNSRSRTALPRHRTLRAAVDWSYELLSDGERRVLERLAVFAGGFTLEAAERVCAGGEIPESHVLDFLTSLAMRSLVTMQEDDGQARYRLLETIREYADARRREHVDDVDVRARHAEYFLSLAQRLEPDLILGRPRALQQLDVEHDNVRAALGFSAERQAGATLGLPLASAVMWYWFHRQLWREGFTHYETALATAVNPDAQAKAGALQGAGLFGLYIAQPNCRERLCEAEDVWRATGNRRWLAFTLICRSIEARLRGDAAEARSCAEEAVGVGRDLGDAWVVALATAHALVPVLVSARDWDRAERSLEEAGRIYLDHDYTIGVAYVLDARANVALQRGRLDEASAFACASLRTDPQPEGRWLAGRSLRTLGDVALARADARRAAWLIGAAAGMYEAIGANPLSPERSSVAELGERARAAMSAEAFDEAWRGGHDAKFQAAVAFALEAETAAAPALAATPAAPESPPRSVLRVCALGSLEILVDDEPLASEALRHSRPRELLVYLLMHPQGCTRERIGADFWPDASAAQVKNNFHVTLHQLRKALGPDVVRYERGTYRIDTVGGVELDALRFEARISDALRQLERAAEEEDARVAAIEDINEALTLYRGPFLANESFGEWQVEIRDRLARVYESGLDALAAEREARGQHVEAIDVLRRLVAADALNEDAARRLMRALARDGRRGEALRAFERLTSDLSAELGVAPERKSVQLAERIREGAAV
jgi:predicted ATPase/DNA-binding SARP family transcriptional activator